MIKIFTIGFTKKTAEDFFGLLNSNPISKLVDTRLNNVSQLAGFAKKDDLKFFTEELCKIDYVHALDLAPTAEILAAYKKKEVGWDIYAKNFMQLLKKRKIEDLYHASELDGACLMCSEHLPHHCHRKLVAEYLKKKWKRVEIIHLT